MPKTVIALLLVLSSDVAIAWNLSAKHINALKFDKSGRIEFTLFRSGSAGAEFFCKIGVSPQWFEITPCATNNAQCLAGTNRMASALLSAKLSGTPVHVQRNACQVTEVALKPMP